MHSVVDGTALLGKSVCEEPLDQTDYYQLQKFESHKSLRCVYFY